MKLLVEDGGKIKKATMDGLEEIEELNFEDGNECLGEIVGNLDKSFDMNYEDELEDSKLYSYKIVGYRDIEGLSIK